MGLDLIFRSSFRSALKNAPTSLVSRMLAIERQRLMNSRQRQDYSSSYLHLDSPYLVHFSLDYLDDDDDDSSSV